MKSLRIVQLLAGTLGLGLSSCLTSPDYSNTPSIAFKEVRVVRARPENELPIDTLTFVVDFQDGDGDLGLSNDDVKSDMYKERQFNYFLQPYLKNPSTGEYELFASNFPDEYSFTYPRLFEEQKNEPLRGELRYKLPLTLGSPFFPGDTVRFTISILDRAFHQSNTVTTSPIAIQPQ